MDESHGVSTQSSTLRGRGRAIKLTWVSMSVGKHSAAAPAIVGARTLSSAARLATLLQPCRLATPLAPRSVGVKAADQERYSGRNALAVPLQTDRESVKAFEQERGPKTARLQQRRQAGG